MTMKILCFTMIMNKNKINIKIIKIIKINLTIKIISKIKDIKIFMKIMIITKKILINILIQIKVSNSSYSNPNKTLKIPNKYIKNLQ